MRKFPRFVLLLACAVEMTSLVAAGGCSSGSGSSQTRSTQGAPPSTSGALRVRPEPGVNDRVVVRGNAVVDGGPFDSQSLGAVVLRDGLVTPCQETLPPVESGIYAVTVLADTEASGCGGPGAEIVVWTFAQNRILYATDAVPWPGYGQTARTDARFSTRAPSGAVPPLAEFNGAVFGANGQQLPAGTRVEAYVGPTRCGVASVRTTPDFTGYILAVVGPESIAGCTRGAALTFRIDGRPAAPTSVVNTPPGQRASLDLRLS